MTLVEAAGNAGSSWAVHRGHLILLALWVLVVGAVLVRGRLRGRVRGEPAATPPRSRWLWGAAAASVLAAGVHLSVIGEHFREATLYGAFFLVVTVVQFGWAALLLWRRTRLVLFAGAAASALVAVLWLATRTVGIPIGPDAGATEAFGALDVTSSAAEVLVAVFAGLAVGALGALREGAEAAARRDDLAVL